MFGLHRIKLSSEDIAVVGGEKSPQTHGKDHEEGIKVALFPPTHTHAYTHTHEHTHTRACHLA